MEESAIELLYLTFQDTDGLVGFSMQEASGEPQNPSFTLDSKRRSLVLRRRPGQIIKLEALSDAFLAFLKTAKKIRFHETQEDSSAIVRRYEATVARLSKFSAAS